MEGGRPAPAAEADERFGAADVAVLAGGHAVHDMYNSFLPPLLPILMEKFSLSTSQAGLLNVFWQWPGVLQPLIGYAGDRADLRWLVILAPAITGAATSLLGAAPSYGILALLLVAAGFSTAGIHAVGPVLVSNRAGGGLGRSLGLWTVGGGLGYTVGPLVLVAAVTVLQPEGAFPLMAVGLAASALLYVRLRKVSRDAAVRRRPQPWRQALAAIAPMLLPVTGITIARSFIVAGLGTYLPVFLKMEGGDLWFAGASLSLVEAAGMAGSLTVSTVSDRLGRRRALALSLALSAPLMGVFVLLQGYARLPILLLLGFISVSALPVMMALLQESFPRNRALVNGLYMGLNFLTNAGATVLMGVLSDHCGMRTVYWISAALPLLGLPLVARLPGRHAGAPTD